MYEYHIEGGFPVKGTVKASGNKNAALPCIAAAVLTDEPVRLKNLPEIEDVGVMLDVFKAFGGSVEKKAPNEYELRLETVRSSEIPANEARKIRASILFAGPLLARTRKAILPPPGGDVIGRRRLDTHFLALTELGAQVHINGRFVFSANKLIGKDIFLDEASVTATENAVMAASMAEGTTIINNAASEPHVQDLCRLLTAMGAKISGIGSNILTIEGVPKLHGAEFTIGPDFMEIGSFIGLAAVTRGSLTITDVKPSDMRPIKLAFNKLGITWSIEGSTLTVPAQQSLQVNCDLGGMIPKIDDSPWPGFPPDLTSIMTVIATQVEGTVLIHEKMFESRMFFVDKLIGMGARIILCDPHRAVVSGPSTLHGSELVSPDVRAGMALVIAACCARGESIISNIYQIERGYEHLVEKLKSIGVQISRREVDS
ncbi:UDP-N-acetylglucosamine 1-carboxyvinyltransferase [Treponema phagedenis]|uniref:UDP-N-acetylglucosamine 1-carboxyvinyltransferase n=1 Tax=Treponema phagedenis TaxID=162 RepID=A0A0B7GSU2_TREPH|nr:UDP-N-acetylglucosamine 1-carboxyvinyltransferase [Treponema phagedenis]EFW39410.1 UDP-N-acetylglucosamine 1-carboxyvinyltransferase [Treponema phagedenis F0421]NVP23110.1 UDP-N-acetylglucosamine 1-carboxyvinyltransferase [Treponema phagedenis]QEJ95020.1 UDP-N-acetylglucosamine 1-carboxyvinyltransferase [Treponema phagedenis]QEJ98084.1 UDP-N-acetylglucosamine 1-carboxyvinyltransferase [Treponema phagedenis]QEK00943.1 UDP-N-acetylglucosamine 1-carboxyvinyltransferase [Treponema phagedenis]